MIPAFQIALATISVAMVLLILLHRGRGGGLSDLFGGGISTGLGGSSVAERNLDRITIGLAVIWIALIASLLILTKID
jgi:preprotein translocase subunit SecG